MNIRWFGQSSFLLTLKNGTKILIDPYNRLLGYKMPKFQVDILIVSHNHRDHNQIQVAKGNYLLVNEPKEYKWKDVQIRGIKTFHDNEQGVKKGDNIVFVIQCEDLTICHCGDLGHILTEHHLKEIGNVDILMIPVGGSKTIDAVDATHVIKQLNPNVTIPMHYRTKALGPLGPLLFDKVDKFLKLNPPFKTDLKEVEINKSNLDEFRGVITFDYRQT